DRDGTLAALERLQLHRRQPPRRDEGGDAEQRAGHARREEEGQKDRKIFHAFIVAGAARPARAVGGLLWTGVAPLPRQPWRRVVPLPRHWFRRCPPVVWRGTRSGRAGLPRRG